MSVKIVPLNLFSDDTSGNTTKKWNKFESCVMSLAAMPFKEQCKADDIFFIYTSNKLSITEMLPELVKDLEALEKGVEMFDVDGSTTVEQERVDGDAHARRRKEDLVEICQHCNGNPNNAGLRSNSDTSYKLTGGEALLSLQSWDPSKDFPVEILHIILLGVVKNIMIGMVPFYPEKEVKHLEESFFNYQSKAFTRKHCTPFRLCGSYLGRDFKIIIQQMPIILYDLTQRRLKSNNDSKANILDCFVKLGSLVSLLYMQNIEAYLDIYVDKVRSATKELVAAIIQYDTLPALSAPAKKKTISSTLKMHLLHHLHEDILHFGSPVRYETERGEQFNKFIREHILHTNRQSPSRDVLCLLERGVSRHISPKVKLFQQFRSLIISRELADNNSRSKSIVVGMAGLFSFSSGAFLVFDKITAIEKNTVVIVPYSFKLASDQTPSPTCNILPWL
ncbi:hypothetical protein BDF14DRAFT_1883356 [Spinellus fusiger]|nr:hypothetical protein BDF14DRAFT_1883356 [Spinellus fusiger]